MGQVNVNSPDRSGSPGTAAMAVVVALLALVVGAAVFFFVARTTVVDLDPRPGARAQRQRAGPPRRRT